MYKINKLRLTKLINSWIFEINQGKRSIMPLKHSYASCLLRITNWKYKTILNRQYSKFKAQTTKARCIRQAKLYETDINAHFILKTWLKYVITDLWYKTILLDYLRSFFSSLCQSNSPLSINSRNLSRFLKYMAKSVESMAHSTTFIT